MEGVFTGAMKVEVLCRGFPGKADVGFLGLSNVALIATESERILFDTVHGSIEPLARRGRFRGP